MWVCSPENAHSAANAHATTPVELSRSQLGAQPPSPQPGRVTLAQAQGAASAMEEVGRLCMAARDNFAVQLEAAMPILGDALAPRSRSVEERVVLAQRVVDWLIGWLSRARTLARPRRMFSQTVPACY